MTETGNHVLFISGETDVMCIPVFATLGSWVASLSTMKMFDSMEPQNHCWRFARMRGDKLFSKHRTTYMHGPSADCFVFVGT